MTYWPYDTETPIVWCPLPLERPLSVEALKEHMRWHFQDCHGLYSPGLREDQLLATSEIFNLHWLSRHNEMWPPHVCHTFDYFTSLSCAGKLTCCRLEIAGFRPEHIRGYIPTVKPCHHTVWFFSANNDKVQQCYKTWFQKQLKQPSHMDHVYIQAALNPSCYFQSVVCSGKDVIGGVSIDRLNPFIYFWDETAASKFAALHGMQLT